MNLKHFLSGASVAFAVILFRLIDKYVIDITTLLGAFMVAIFSGVVVKAIQSIPTLDRELKKPTYLTLWIIAFVCLLGSFHFFDL
ncbi:hypothetical protein SAMN05421670_0585 [Psychrobacillus psychrotolerans]|uniref:Uncharacterized protein n=1 Tax=Psychrobacillus psychrotolerans TaxID=126156 RepID=A0A1I5UXH4_9BACI|nr:hypothetical protein [Psychrobacillus psychrotolerans]SFQ00024.1 hypothetical protein SAMN05421670_0585 [Psychrobacillus psychrotolerans]